MSKNTQAMVNKILKQSADTAPPVGTFIVKIQQSFSTSASKRQMLIYNENRSVMWQSELTDDIRKLLHNRPKAYFNAEIVNDKIKVLDEAEAQKW
jgi:hypothetical protein